MAVDTMRRDFEKQITDAVSKVSLLFSALYARWVLYGCKRCFICNLEKHITDAVSQTIDKMKPQLLLLSKNTLHKILSTVPGTGKNVPVIIAIRLNEVREGGCKSGLFTQ